MNVSKTSGAALAAAAVLALAGLAACNRQHTTTVATAPAGGDPSGHLIGTPPAPPTGNTPETTPVAPNTTEVTKAEETTQKPSEGDNHSYSSVAQDNPQKAGGQDGQASRQQ